MSPFVSANNVVYPVPLNEHLCRVEELEQVHRDVVVVAVVVVVVAVVSPLCQNPGRKPYTLLVFPPLGTLVPTLLDQGIDCFITAISRLIRQTVFTDPRFPGILQYSSFRRPD